MRGVLRALLAAVVLTGCSGSSPGVPVEVTIPPGSGFGSVVDSLVARGVITQGTPFRVFARLRGDDRRVRSGRYALTTQQPWREVLAILVEGRVITVPMTVPEGFRLPQIAPRIAEVTQRPEDEILRALQAPGAEQALGVPGPGLEGYLFPDTYRFAAGVPVETVLRTMAQRYQAVWTPQRRARLDSLGMTERELVTLASIVQAEARKASEMPRISSVYHNRLRRGWLLQADPTVLYALGGYRARLLFAAIDSVADNPYNTYRQPGLPPGPIGAPGDEAIEAALYPIEEPYLYFVAWPDGSHVFSRTLAEHNRAVAAARRERGRPTGDTAGDRGRP